MGGKGGGGPMNIECGGGNGTRTPPWLKDHFRNSVDGKWICYEFKMGTCTKPGNHDDVVHACNHDQCREIHSIAVCPRKVD